MSSMWKLFHPYGLGVTPPPRLLRLGFRAAPAAPANPTSRRHIATVTLAQGFSSWVAPPHQRCQYISIVRFLSCKHQCISELSWQSQTWATSLPSPPFFTSGPELLNPKMFAFRGRMTSARRQSLGRGSQVLRHHLGSRTSTFCF